MSDEDHAVPIPGRIVLTVGRPNCLDEIRQLPDRAEQLL
jgi:hypothetical protein